MQAVASNRLPELGHSHKESDAARPGEQLDDPLGTCSKTSSLNVRGAISRQLNKVHTIYCITVLVPTALERYTSLPRHGLNELAEIFDDRHALKLGRIVPTC